MSLKNVCIRWSVLFSLLLSLAGCQSKKEEGQKQEPSSPKPSSKELRLYLQSEPIAMHPQKAGNRFSLIVTRELFEGLMRLDKRGYPNFAIADKLEVSNDKKVYTFHLRPTQWSNGMPVTAHDFEYAWKWAVSRDATTNYSYAFYCIKNARKARLGEVGTESVGVHAANDATLIVELENPAPYFVELTANPLFSPICKAVCEKNPNWCDTLGPDYVSNGPFVLSKWKPQAEIILTKNDLYWDSPAVAVQKLHFPIITDGTTALSMFEQNQLDWAGDPFGSLPLDAIPKLKQDSKLYARDIESVNWLELNVRHPLLSSKKIRKALCLAVNRQEIVEHLLQGGEKPAFTLLPRSLTLLDAPSFKDNAVEEAKALFEEGLKELKYSRPSLPVIHISHSVDPRDKMMAQAVQQQWKKALNVDIQLSPSDWNTHLKRLATGEFEVAGVNWYTFYADPLYNLEWLKYKTGTYNGTGWEHPYYTSLLDQSDREGDVTRRDKILKEAEAFVLDEMPVIPLCYNTSKFVKNPSISGEILAPVLGTYEWKQVDVENGGMVIVNNAR
jgi:oligopeptide transport system substrate-binding protein